MDHPHPVPQRPRPGRTTLVQMDAVAGPASGACRDRCVLTLLNGPAPGTLHKLEGAEMILGRDETADACIPDPGISRAHARVFRAGAQVLIEDLESTNGTFVNDARIGGPRLLADGDRVRLGREVVLKLALQDELEEQAAVRLYESAVRDPLTGVFNRRSFEERLAAELSFATRHQSELSVVMFDVDHFKRVNDVHGHPAGDAVLRCVASSVARMIRAEDVLARYGGEEFVVIARGISARNASILGERIRAEVERLAVPWERGQLSVTVSVGVATADSTRRFGTAVALVCAADQALYLAKTQGRNRVGA